MKKKNLKLITSICLTLGMMLTMFTGVVLAAPTPEGHLIVNNEALLYNGVAADADYMPNASYDKSTNTLTLDNYSGTYISAQNMGDDFKIKVIGTCSISGWQQATCSIISIGNVTFIGDGTLNIGDDNDFYGIYMCSSDSNTTSTMTINGPQIVINLSAEGNLPIQLGEGGSYNYPGKLVLQSGSITANASGGAMKIYGGYITAETGTTVTYKEGDSESTATVVSSLTDEWSTINDAFCSKKYINIVATKATSVTATSTEDLTTKTLAAIANMASTDTLSLPCQNGTQVDPSVLAAAKEKGIKVQISYVDSNGATVATWAFDKITDASKAFNPALSIGTTVADIDKKLSSLNNNYITLSFSYSGNLPGTAKVTLALNESQLAKYKNGTTLYYYYYNPSTKLFELVDSATVNNNSINLTMTHCSEYILTDQKLAASYTSSSAKTGDNSNAILYMVVMCMAIGGASAIRFTKRKYN